jgi:hypothetical protein
MRKNLPKVQYKLSNFGHPGGISEVRVNKNIEEIQSSKLYSAGVSPRKQISNLII